MSSRAFLTKTIVSPTSMTTRSTQMSTRLKSQTHQALNPFADFPNLLSQLTKPNTIAQCILIYDRFTNLPNAFSSFPRLSSIKLNESEDSPRLPLRNSSLNKYSFLITSRCVGRSFPSLPTSRRSTSRRTPFRSRPPSSRSWLSLTPTSRTIAS